MRRPRFYRGLNPRERALMWPVFRASLPSLYYIGIGDGLGFGDRPWTDWGYDPNWPDFDYQINVGDYASVDLSKMTWTPFGTLCDLLVHEMTHVWQYAHGRQVKGSSVWASTISSYDFTLHQQVFIRTTAIIPGFSGDIISSSVCAPWRPSPCAPLLVPNLVKANKIVLLDPQGSLIRNARLEFRENTKAVGRVVATRMTNAEGIADVSALLERGGLLRMSVNHKVAYSSFLIQFAKGRTQGQQRVNVFNWRCRGDVMHGAMVQP